MNKLSLPLMLLCTALSLTALAAPETPQQAADTDQASRRAVLEQQKQAVDQLNLPPAQTLAEPPAMLELPVDKTDSPGAAKK